MKKIILLVATVVILLLSAFVPALLAEWNISEGYAIKFKAAGAEGIFNKFTGQINFDEGNLDASKFNVRLDVNSINTGNGMKNRHAKSEKWFDAEKFPSIDFTSRKLSKTVSGYLVTGKLLMHGVEKEISIPFTFINNTFSGSFSVNRIDYNIGSMEGMSKKVSNEIQLTITVPVTKENHEK